MQTRILERVEIRNFRNLSPIFLHPHPNFNLFWGLNGQGKTSLLEAVYFLCALRSFRTSQKDQLIAYGKREAVLGSCVKTTDSDNSSSVFKTELKVELFANPLKKRAWVQQKQCASDTDYLLQKLKPIPLGFHAISFNPHDHDLIRGEPQVRRSYLDSLLASESEAYLLSLKKYRKVLQQRNSLLKNQFGEPWSSSTEAMFDSYSETLCDYGSWLISKRLIWLRNFLPKFKEQLASFVSVFLPAQMIQLGYFSPLVKDPFQDLPSHSELRVKFRNQLDVLANQEKKVGSSLVGPHREDWGFYLGGRPLQGQGSQGEIRSFLMAFKLTEGDLFFEKQHFPALFLLDDFSSELDGQRRGALLKLLSQKNIQTFVSSTENLDWIEGKSFEVRTGQITGCS